MTATAVPKVKNKESASFGLVESATVNSITDFTHSKLNQTKLINQKGNEDFINSFICLIIFYIIFCVSLVFHILLDLGLASFIKNKFNQLILLAKKMFFEKSPVFA